MKRSISLILILAFIGAGFGPITLDLGKLATLTNTPSYSIYAPGGAAVVGSITSPTASFTSLTANAVTLSGGVISGVGITGSTFSGNVTSPGVSITGGTISGVGITGSTYSGNVTSPAVTITGGNISGVGISGSVLSSITSAGITAANIGSLTATSGNVTGLSVLSTTGNATFGTSVSGATTTPGAIDLGSSIAATPGTASQLKLMMYRNGTTYYGSSVSGNELWSYVPSTGAIYSWYFGGVSGATHTFSATAHTTTVDVEITDFNKGVILKSPNGTRWRVTIDNSGVLTRTSL